MADNKTKVNEDAGTTAAAATLQTKSAIMSGLLATVSSMSHDELMKWWPDAMTLAADVSNSAAAQNQASIQMKPTDATSGVVKEETAALFEGEDLSEDAVLKISTLIENAVDVRAAIIKEELEEEYRTKLVEEAAKIQEDLVEKIDSYATYAAEQWMEKNQVAIESTIKVERAAKLVEGLASLLKQCGVEVPTDQETAFESLSREKEDLEDRLNEQLEETLALRNALTAMNAMQIFNEAAEGLTVIETDKFKKLVEDVDVDVAPEDLKKKLAIIREAHFRASTKRAPTGLNEQVDPGTVQATTEETKTADDPRIAAYAKAISRASDRYARGPFAR